MKKIIIKIKQSPWQDQNSFTSFTYDTLTLQQSSLLNFMQKTLWGKTNLFGFQPVTSVTGWMLLMQKFIVDRLGIQLFIFQSFSYIEKIGVKPVMRAQIRFWGGLSIGPPLCRLWAQVSQKSDEKIPFWGTGWKVWL